MALDPDETYASSAHVRSCPRSPVRCPRPHSHLRRVADLNTHQNQDCLALYETNTQEVQPCPYLLRTALEKWDERLEASCGRTNEDGVCMATGWGAADAGSAPMLDVVWMCRAVAASPGRNKTHALSAATADVQGRRRKMRRQNGAAAAAGGSPKRLASRSPIRHSR